MGLSIYKMDHNFYENFQIFRNIYLLKFSQRREFMMMSFISLLLEMSMPSVKRN